MWTLLIIFFNTLISFILYFYFRNSTNFFSLVYNKELFKSFLKFNWVLGFFVTIGIIIRLYLDKNTLNPQDKAYDFHNLASSNVKYVKLGLDEKIKFLITMLTISSFVIFLYIFILLLLPFRTLILVTLTQIFGFDFAGLPIINQNLILNLGKKYLNMIE